MLQGAAAAPKSQRASSEMAEESLAEQRRIEAADAVPFETYRQRYLATEKLEA